GGGEWVPSAVLTVLAAAPQLAVAFQRDIKSLGLDRRLSQIEIEHLVFRRFASGATVAGVQPVEPLERLEAALQGLLDAVGRGEQVPHISEALRGAEAPGPVLGPILDDLAFHSDVDLDRARELLVG